MQHCLPPRRRTRSRSSTLQSSPRGRSATPRRRRSPMQRRKRSRSRSERRSCSTLPGSRSPSPPRGTVRGRGATGMRADRPQRRQLSSGRWSPSPPAQRRRLSPSPATPPRRRRQSRTLASSVECSDSLSPSGRARARSSSPDVATARATNGKQGAGIVEQTPPATCVVQQLDKCGNEEGAAAQRMVAGGKVAGDWRMAAPALGHAAALDASIQACATHNGTNGKVRRRPGM